MQAVNIGRNRTFSRGFERSRGTKQLKTFYCNNKHLK